MSTLQNVFTQHCINCSNWFSLLFLVLQGLQGLVGNAGNKGPTVGSKHFTQYPTNQWSKNIYIGFYGVIKVVFSYSSETVYLAFILSTSNRLYLPLMSHFWQWEELYIADGCHESSRLSSQCRANKNLWSHFIEDGLCLLWFIKRLYKQRQPFQEFSGHQCFAQLVRV